MFCFALFRTHRFLPLPHLFNCLPPLLSVSIQMRRRPGYLPRRFFSLPILSYRTPFYSTVHFFLRTRFLSGFSALLSLTLLRILGSSQYHYLRFPPPFAPDTPAPRRDPLFPPPMHARGYPLCYPRIHFPFVRPLSLDGVSFAFHGLRKFLFCPDSPCFPLQSIGGRHVHDPSPIPRPGSIAC